MNLKGLIHEGAIINVAPSCFFINPKRINLWIALDETSEKGVRRIIEMYGPATEGFYRGVFPDPVVKRQFALPNDACHGFYKKREDLLSQDLRK